MCFLIIKLMCACRGVLVTWAQLRHLDPSSEEYAERKLVTVGGVPCPGIVQSAFSCIISFTVATTMTDSYTFYFYQ